MKELGIQLLGAFRIVWDGAALSTVWSSRMQALLAYLALHFETPVSRQRLAFLFWPDSSEPQARTNLRQLLHHLRAAWPDVDRFLDSDAQALRWREDAPVTVDVLLFNAAVTRAENVMQQGDASAVREALEDADRLYRGDLLPGMYDDWIDEERRRLRQKHAEALERLISLFENGRQYAEAIGAAERLLAEDPLREKLYQKLMRLYAFSGDRAAALHVFHRCATNLRRELDIEPDVVTRTLRDEVARIKLDVDALPAGPPPVMESRLVGREREWTALLDAWSAATAGRASFMLVSGEAGIGKTRIVEELLAHAGRRGTSTARAACYLSDHPMAFAPVADWLRSPSFRTVLEGLGAPVLSQLARVLPGILLDHPGVAPPPPFTETWQRRHFFEALARALLAAPQPLLLFVDDAQWCDAETVQWLEYLLHVDQTARLLVLGAARLTEIDSDHPVAAMLADLSRGGRGGEIALGPLSAGDTALLAGRICGRELDNGAARFVYEQTRGNPLFIVEVARAGAHGGAVLPPRVHSVITTRLAGLSESARELAAVAAVGGRPFTSALLTRATASDEERIARATDELWKHGIIRAHEGDSYDFTHGLVRDVAYSELGPERRRLLHRRMAAALETLHAADPDAVSSQIGEHYEKGGLAWEAVQYFERAAVVVRRRYAEQEAAGFLERALHLVKNGPRGVENGPRGEEWEGVELRLLASLGLSLIATLGYASPEVGRTYARARVLCELLGETVRRSAVLAGSWLFHIVREELEASKAIATRYVELGAGDNALSAAGAFALGSSLFHLGEIRQAGECFESAIAHPASGQHPFFEFGPELGVFARSYLAHVLCLRGRPEQAAEMSRQSIARAEDLSHPFSLALALAYDAMLHQFRNEPDGAEQQADNAAALCLKYGFLYYLSWTPIIRGWAHARQGAATTGLGEMREGYSALGATGARLRAPYYLGLMAEAAREIGLREDCARFIADARALAQQNGEHWVHPELTRIEGDLLLDRGDGREAEIKYRQALRSAQTHDLRLFELRAAARLCRVGARGAPQAGMLRLLRATLDHFDRNAAVPDVLEARTLLARVAKNAR